MVALAAMKFGRNKQLWLLHLLDVSVQRVELTWSAFEVQVRVELKAAWNQTAVLQLSIV